MSLFHGKRGDDDRDAQTQREVEELLDQYHHRASLTDGDQRVVALGKMLENVVNAMERLDVDIDTDVAIEDFASFDDMIVMVQQMQMGPLLAVHVVNNALRIMAARYPADLVRAPLPENYDLRKLLPLKLSDVEHETARAIFNRRTASAGDFEIEDEMVAAALEPLGAEGQLQVFVALFYMYGLKIGAMKHRTGIP